jgi:hypothetical protein
MLDPVAKFGTVVCIYTPKGSQVFTFVIFAKKPLF